MSKLRKICRESALRIAALCISQSSIATADLPAAVGPQITRSLSPAKAPLYLVPGEMNDRGAAVHVVRGERGIPQCREERAHLPLRQLLASLDCRLAGDGGRESLVLCRRSRDAVASQRVQRFTQTTLGIKALVRHWHGVDDERVSPKSLYFETQALEILPIGVERLALSRTEVKGQGKQQ